MRKWIGPRADWPERGPMAVGYVLEALGGTPDGFARVLDLADNICTGHVPGASPTSPAA